MQNITLTLLLAFAPLQFDSAKAATTAIDPVDVIMVIEAPVNNPHAESVARARTAVESAAVDAITEISASTMLDLDIRFAGRTSLMLASGRIVARD